jgi:hypothetical protein
MSDVPPIPSAIEAGGAKAAADLLPLVYDELRKLAAARLADEKPGQTLQPTALVHEASLRLVGGNQPQDWNGRGHFFAAAAEATRGRPVAVGRHSAHLRLAPGGPAGNINTRPMPRHGRPPSRPTVRSW